MAFASSERTPNADDVPALLLQQSSAQDDDLTTQPSGISSRSAAAGAAPPGTASHATADPASIRAQLQLLQHRFATSASDRRRSDEIGTTSSAEKSRCTKFLFPPDLQDPLLSARRYRIVKELGKGSYGKVFLAWDERRQYACDFVMKIHYSILIV